MFKKYRSEKGQSMVEFALILPILLIIIGGIIDFGWLFYNQSALNNGAREGARFAVVNTSEPDPVTLTRNKVNAVSPASIKPITISVVYSNITSPLEGDVTITLQSTISILTPVLGVFVKGQTKVLHANITMRVES